MYSQPTLYTTGQNGAFGHYLYAYWLIWLIVVVLAIAALWRIFSKAGEAGWQAIIPIWNTIVLLKVVGRPWWWILLLLIPIVDIVILIIVYYDLAKSFGHGVGFTIGLIFLNIIFFLILGFGGSKYLGPRGMAPAPAYVPPAGPPTAPPSAPPA